MKEIQPYSSFNAIAVGPERVTELKLSGGKTIPYVYQLSVQSTVPFIRLIGSSGGQKLISFTEKIIVPPGEMVTVENASFHPGDIWIGSGWDPAVLPARITVPVPIDNVTAPGSTLPGHVLDVRRARRAFVAGLSTVAAASATFFQFGFSRIRSHAIVPTASDLVNPEPKYTSNIVMPLGTEPGLMPLGYKAAHGDADHALLDTASFSINQASASNSGALYYVLEYA